MTAILNVSLMSLSLVILVFLPNFFDVYKTQEIYSMSHTLSMDTLSVALSLLVLWVSLMSVMYISDKNSEAFKTNMLVLNASLTLLMMLSFLLTDLFIFFVSYEISLIPILFMVWGWGGSFKKSKAGVFLLLYTSVMSMPLLLGILITQKMLKCYTWGVMEMYSHFSSFSSFIILFMMLAFFVKTPIYGLHMWLPKAHVEASTMGSMILAGSLLKMGIYGVLRVPFMHASTLVSSVVFLSVLTITIGGMCISSVLMIMMYDGKIAIALSSVSHMNMLLASLMVFSLSSFSSSYLVSLSHGFISPAMFFLFSMFYKSMKSRNIMLSRAATSMSCLSLVLMCFYVLMSNTGCPPSYNFWGEFTVFLTLLTFNPMFSVLPLFITSMCILSSASFMFSRMTSGDISFLKKWNMTPSNLYSLFFLLIPSLAFWKYPV
uniref:NADH-ubiquinone oxidoreductase chain 4 n=1 Tax=Gordius sp. VVA-2019 TaxID=2586752 RepID=A0A514ABT7_9BILA|nr:NADH dehydrogenase subunit 4 [Gordius sp. VVA-2019]